jgi:hypothetical protein
MLEELALKTPEDLGDKGVVDFLRNLIVAPPEGELRPVGGGQFRTREWVDPPGGALAPGAAGGSAVTLLDPQLFTLTRKDRFADYPRSLLSPRLQGLIPDWWGSEWLPVSRRIEIKYLSKVAGWDVSLKRRLEAGRDHRYPGPSQGPRAFFEGTISTEFDRQGVVTDVIFFVPEHPWFHDETLQPDDYPYNTQNHLFVRPVGAPRPARNLTMAEGVQADDMIRALFGLGLADALWHELGEEIGRTTLAALRVPAPSW